MIDITVVDRAVQLKKELDAAYLVFKKMPTIEASARWTTATRAYHDYCINVVSQLVTERINETAYREDVIANFDRYKKCTCCDSEILYPVKSHIGEDEVEVIEDFVASSDFVDGFPGWCYPCLVEYCKTHTCDECTASRNPANCLFAEVKKLHVQEEA